MAGQGLTILILAVMSGFCAANSCDCSSVITIDASISISASLSLFIEFLGFAVDIIGSIVASVLASVTGDLQVLVASFNTELQALFTLFVGVHVTSQQQLDALLISISAQINVVVQAGLKVVAFVGITDSVKVQIQYCVSFFQYLVIICPSQSSTTTPTTTTTKTTTTPTTTTTKTTTTPTTTTTKTTTPTTTTTSTTPCPCAPTTKPSGFLFNIGKK